MSKDHHVRPPAQTQEDNTMSNFFYDLNKKLNNIRETPETNHNQLNERDEGKPGKNFAKIAKDAGERYGSKAAGERVAGAVRNKLKSQGKLEEEGMSRAAKGYEKYGREGMEALAKAGRDGKALDPVRKKYNKYDESMMADEGNAFGNAIQKAKADGIQPGEKVSVGGKQYPVKEAAGPVDYEKVLEAIAALYGDDMWDNDAMGDLAQDLEQAGPTDRELDFIIAKGKLPTRLKGIRFTNTDDVQFGHLDEKSGAPMSSKQKSFAALAPPANKITFADKIAGAKKEVDEMLGDVAANAMKKAIGSGRGRNAEMDENSAPGGFGPAEWAKVSKLKARLMAKGMEPEEAEETAADQLGFDYYDVLDYLDSMNEEKSKGTAFDMSTPRAVTPRVGSVERGHKHDIKHTATGRMVTRRTDPQGNSVGADDETDAQAAPRGRGRPKGPAKAPERVTAKATKHKGSRKMADEDLDTDGVMMTQPSNMSSEGYDPGEYDQEGDMAKDDIKTIVRHAQALEKILGDNDNLPEWVQSKLAKIEGMMIAVDEYMQNQDSDDEMAMGEEKTNKRDNRAERAGKRVTKDIEYDEKKKDNIHGKKRRPEDAKAERAGKRVAKDIEYDEKKKDKKVEETTTSGSVATSTGTAKSKGGFSFGQGVYESLDRRYKQALNEGMSINISMDEQGHNTLNVTATDEDAQALAQLLKMAGLGGQGHSCPSCGQESCGCDQMVDENQPNWPTNTETSHNAMQYSGGLNGPKSTGQTTTPVVASQLRRQHSMEESVKLERSLFNTWKNYKG